MNDIVRKAIVSAPLAACVLMLAWYWLGGVDRPGRAAESAASTVLPATAGVVRTQVRSSGDAAMFSSWMSYQRELDDRAGTTETGDEMPESAPTPTPAPAEIAMPEPVYQQDTQTPPEQRISEAAFSAVHGETPQTRAAALGELAVIGDAGILGTLGEALADPELQVQLAAIAAARRLAQYHGDENGDVEGWLIQAGNSADPAIAAAARAGANELAQNQGQDLPFP